MNARVTRGADGGQRHGLSRGWWLKNRRYLLFVLREVSSVFVALVVVGYIVQFALLAAGPGPYQRYLDLMDTPAWVALHVVALLFILVHAISWFIMLPAVTPVKLRNWEMPQGVVTGAVVVVWLVISGLIAQLLL